jgi:hypothetical protein
VRSLGRLNYRRKWVISSRTTFSSRIYYPFWSRTSWRSPALECSAFPIITINIYIDIRIDDTSRNRNILIYASQMDVESVLWKERTGERDWRHE